MSYGHADSCDTRDWSVERSKHFGEYIILADADQTRVENVRNIQHEHFNKKLYAKVATFDIYMNVGAQLKITLDETSINAECK